LAAPGNPANVALASPSSSPHPLPSTPLGRCGSVALPASRACDHR
jgi:hypothetical protein